MFIPKATVAGSICLVALLLAGTTQTASAATLPLHSNGSLGALSPGEDVEFNTDTGSFRVGADIFSGGRVVTVFARVIPVEVMAFDFTVITIPAGVTVSAIGSRPLVLLARHAVTVNGVVEVSGDRGADGGPSSGGGGAGGGAGLGIFGDSIFVGPTGQILARGGDGGLSSQISPVALQQPQGGQPGSGKGGGGDGGRGGNPRNGGQGGSGSTNPGGGGGGGAAYGGAPGPGGANGDLIVLGGPTPNAGKGAQGGACPTLIKGGDGGAGLNVVFLGFIPAGTGGSGGSGGAPDGGPGVSGNVDQAATTGGSGGGGGGGAISGGPGGAGGVGGSGAGGGGGGGGADNCQAGGPGGGGGGGAPGGGTFDIHKFIELLRLLKAGGLHLPGFLQRLADTPLDNLQPKQGNPSSTQGKGGSGGGGAIHLGAASDSVENQGRISVAGGASGDSGVIGVFGQFVNSGTADGEVFQSDGLRRNLWFIGGGGGGGGAGGDGSGGQTS